MVENELEEYVEMYSSEIYNSFPNLFKYLNYILVQAGYMEDIREYNQKYILDEHNYENKIDINCLLNICIEVLDTIDTSLKDKFILYLNNGTIDFNDNEDTISATQNDNNNLSINIKRNYNIEDILATIHEFFHGIHLEKYNLEFIDDWYIITEMFAITGELYTLFYLMDKEFCTTDLEIYLNKFIESMFIHNYVTLENGLFIDLYYKMQSINKESLEQYIVMNNLPENYNEILTEDDESADTDEFNYHESATYALAFPLSIILARRLLMDEEYKKIFMDVLRNINMYDIPTLFDKLGIKEYIENDDKLFELMNFINKYLTKKFTNQKINIKDNKELW